MIVSTWVLCPVISAVLAMGLYKLTKYYLNKTKIHLLRLDAYTRATLIFAGLLEPIVLEQTISLM